jgi:hypothetical protein
MRAFPLVSLALTLALALPLPAGAREERVPRGARQCIPLHEIRDESAETGSKLIFHGGGGSAWRNHLPEPCEELLRINNLDKLKLQHVRGDQLCAGDTVEVIDHDGDVFSVFGGGETRAISCKLGLFEPISEMSLTEEIRR